MKIYFLIFASLLMATACGSENGATSAQEKKPTSLKYTTFLTYDQLSTSGQSNAEHYLKGKMRYRHIKYTIEFGSIYIYDISPDGQCFKRTMTSGRSSHMAKIECTPQVLDAIDPERIAAIRAKNP